MNLAAGLLCSGLSAIIQFATVRYYLGALGAESYGLLGILALMQAGFMTLDLGFGAAVSRKLAQMQASGEDSQAARNLLHTAGWFFMAVAIFAALVLHAVSTPLAALWLRSTHIPGADLGHAITLIALVAATRFPMLLFQNALAGLQKMYVASIINVLMLALTHGIGFWLLIDRGNDVFSLLAWFVAAGLLHSVAMGAAAAFHAGGPARGRFDTAALAQLRDFALPMAGVAVTGVLLQQLDKVAASMALPLAAFAGYSVCVSLVAVMQLALGPLFSAFYPRLSLACAAGDTGAVVAIFGGGSRVLMSLVTPIAVMGVFHAQMILGWWTHDAAMADQLASTMGWMLLGTLLNGAMHLPHALQLAKGQAREVLELNITLFILSLPASFLLAFRYGADGAAASWALFNFMYLVIGTRATAIGSPEINVVTWIFRDILAPATAAGCISLVVLKATSWLLTGAGPGLALLAAAAGVGATGCACAWREWHASGLSRSTAIAATNNGVQPAC